MKHLSKNLLIITLCLFAISCNTIKMNKNKEQKVLIETTQGDIIVKLYNETPLHRDNFIKLVKSDFYSGTLFHRVINEFMIQGGDPDSKDAPANARLGSGDVGYTIPAEIRTPGIYHKYGALAAARQGDNVNPEKASSGCQFYIVTGRKFSEQQLAQIEQNNIMQNRIIKDSTYILSEKARSDYQTIGGTPHLDGNYTVYGEVIKGMEVAEKISKTETNRQDRPTEDVKIIRMKLIK